MSRRFTYRSTSQLPADRVFAAMVDDECLRARLAKLGGRTAALLEHRVDDGTARFRVRHGLAHDDVPPALRAFMPADFSVERLETWRRARPSRYEGHSEVAVPGAPASATGQMLLTDLARGSELRVDTDVSVRVPLVGGRIEGFVGEQVNHLLAMETAFTIDWAEQHS